MFKPVEDDSRFFGVIEQWNGGKEGEHCMKAQVGRDFLLSSFRTGNQIKPTTHLFFDADYGRKNLGCGKSL